MRIVDVHTHFYPDNYVNLLKARRTIPLVRNIPGHDDPRLIILPSEATLLDKLQKDPKCGTIPGRRLSPHFTSLNRKLNFMDVHKIDVSVLSLPNPWLDFVEPMESIRIAAEVNYEFSQLCAKYPSRLFFFGVLPLMAPVPAIRTCVDQLNRTPYCKGVIMGTTGRGQGLDDPDLLPVFEALAACDLIAFIHPHLGLPNEVWGPRAEQYGHVLSLALGFPMETTIAMTRMLLSGVFEQFINLRVLLAHSGGALPYLAGRIEHAIMHDDQLVREGKAPEARRRHNFWRILREQIYFDSVTYCPVAMRAASELVGSDRLMFGTDHPFFPPQKGDDKGEWSSAITVFDDVQLTMGQDKPGIMGWNAEQVLKLGNYPPSGPVYLT